MAGVRRAVGAAGDWDAERQPAVAGGHLPAAVAAGVEAAADLALRHWAEEAPKASAAAASAAD